MSHPAREPTPAARSRRQMSRISHSRSFRTRGKDRRHHLDPLREIADIQSAEPMKNSPSSGFSLTVREVEDARVFEEPPDDRPDANILRASWHPGTKAAESANDQIDRHAGLRCLAQSLDHLRVFELIHLRDDACRLSSLFVLDLAVQSVRAVAAAWSWAPPAATRSRACPMPGQIVEEIDYVARKPRIAGEQAAGPHRAGRSSHDSCRCRCAHSSASRRSLCAPPAPSWRASSGRSPQTSRARPTRSSSAAQCRFRSSSKRALISITHATCLPRSAARISDLTKGVSSPTRYAVILIATVCGSSAAALMKCSTVASKLS